MPKFGIDDMFFFSSKVMANLKCHWPIMVNVAVYAICYRTGVAPEAGIWDRGRRTLEGVRTKIWRC